MKDGFITVATATPQVAVADCEANTQAILACINEMAAAHAKVMVLPELCITGYTCSDLFWQTKLLDEAEAALSVIAEESRQVAGSTSSNGTGVRSVTKSSRSRKRIARPS